jgi:hypothetical protein
MMIPEPTIDLAGVFATMWHDSAPGLVIDAVLTEHCYRHDEGMHSREKARDEPTIVQVLKAQVLHLV